MVVVPGFGGSCIAPRGAAAGNTWLSPRMLLDPWAWLRINRVTYTPRGEFLPSNPLLDARGFGSEDAVCDLCPEVSALEGVLRMAGGGALPVRTRYFAELRDGLRARGGARMYSAPYDFRRVLDPAYLATYRLDLLDLVARARLEAGGRRAVVVAHSMGAVLANHLLRSEPEWLERNVAHVVDVCPNSEGSALALDSVLNGRVYIGATDGGLKDALARMARNNAGIVLSLPYPAHDDYTALLGDAWSRHASPIMANLRPPGVPGKVGHVLIHGTGHPTPGAAGGTIDSDGVVLRVSRDVPSRLVGPDTVLLESKDHHSVVPCSALLVSTVMLLSGV